MEIHATKGDATAEGVNKLANQIWKIKDRPEAVTIIVQDSRIEISAEQITGFARASSPFLLSGYIGSELSKLSLT